MTMASRILRHLRIKSRYYWDYEVFEKRGIPVVKREKISKSVAVKWLPPNPVIIDCGAFDGSDSITLARLTGGTVHAIEADPQVYAMMKHNTRKYPRVRCHNIALSDADGEATFYCGELDLVDSGSLLTPGAELAETGKMSRSVTVRTQTLATWAGANGITRVDMLWLDMQGSELAMLQASESLVRRTKVIHTEVSRIPAYSNACEYTDLREFLERIGFQLEHEAIPDCWSTGNALFRNRV
jgi:FkbM family methyltransferase